MTVPDATNYTSPATLPSGKKKTKGCFTKMVLGVTLVVSGLMLFLVGILFGTWLPSSVDSRIKDSATTCSMDDVKDSFYAPYDDCDTCVPLYTSFHPFTISNAPAFLTGTAKPRVVEKGPYVYRKFTTRVNVTIDTAANTLSYRSYDRWKFIPEDSCADCNPETDTTTGLDASYFATVGRAKGERALVTALVSNVLAKSGRTPEEITAILATVPQIAFANLMKLLNGLNSLHFPTMASSLSNFAQLLQATDVASFTAAIRSLSQLSLEPYSRYAGVITERSVSDLALGFPSFLGGIAAAGALSECNSIPTDFASLGKTVNQLCAGCASDDPAVSGNALCKGLEKICVSCAMVTDIILNVSPALCDELETRLTVKNKIPTETAQAFVTSSCKRCSPEGGFLFCLVPVPGGVEPSGRDYNDVPVNIAALKPFVQDTGCQVISNISQYQVYDGIVETPIWNMKDVTGLPTLKVLADFARTGLCDMPNTNCQVVNGGDGSSFPPAGASLSGLSNDQLFPEWNLYVSQAFQNLTIFYDTDVKLNGIGLMRYRPSNALMATNPANIVKGTGLPYSGVQNLGYVRGFPVYVSEPFYTNGDARLYQNIELFTKDNVQITEKNIAEHAFKYKTYMDIEPATGRTMNARKRLMGSFSVPKISPEEDQVMTNLNYPNLQANVIIPVFWAEERATVTSDLVSKFKSVKALANAFLPVLIVGIISGILCFLGGGFLIQQHKKAQGRKSIDL